MPWPRGREARRAILANALEAADRLDGVVEDLLSLSRIESGMLALNRRAVDLSSSRAPRSIAPGPSSPPRLWSPRRPARTAPRSSTRPRRPARRQPPAQRRALLASRHPIEFSPGRG